MKRLLLFFALPALMALASCSANNAGKTHTGPITTQDQKVSYGIGYSIGKSIKGESIDGIDLAIVERGIRDAYADKEPAVPEKEIKDALSELRKQQSAKMASQATDNLAAADRFLKENASKEGVKSINDKLQYRVLASGKGKSPSLESNVILHYRGTTLDGKEFDSSYKRGEPASMMPGNLIPGFSQALLKMKEGDKWEIYIHPDLAYGPNSPPGIAPNSLLTFEIEVLEVK